MINYFMLPFSNTLYIGLNCEPIHLCLTYTFFIYIKFQPMASISINFAPYHQTNINRKHRRVLEY